jgi:Ca-activated chloride channel family protein
MECVSCHVYNNARGGWRFHEALSECDRPGHYDFVLRNCGRSTSRRDASDVELLKLTSPLDEFALIQASDRPVVVSGYGSSADTLQTQVALIQSKGRSAVLDGIYMGLQVSKAGRNARKVLLVISDGGENNSRYTETEIRNAIAETGVRVYVAGVNEPVAGSALLLQIAERGGGRYLGMQRTPNLPQVALELISAMRAPL